jgi:hypothetical protein
MLAVLFVPAACFLGFISTVFPPGSDFYPCPARAPYLFAFVQFSLFALFLHRNLDPRFFPPTMSGATL